MTTKVILKKTRGEAVVKLVGIGTIAITLAELALADETVSSPKVDINNIKFSIPSGQSAKVLRNAVEVLDLYNTGEWMFAGSNLPEQITSDISVTLSGAGTVILTLKKIDGYNEPDLQARGYI